MKHSLLFFLVFFTQAVTSQIINIPDANFKYALVNTICVDSNGDGLINSNDSDADTNDDNEIDVDEAAAVTLLLVRDQSRTITSLEGLQYFVNMVEFHCYFQNIPTIDLSSNTELIKIQCIYNNTISIDVSQNTSLESMILTNNALLSLDVSSNLNLMEIRLNNNQLSSIDVSQNPNLIIFQVHNNQLSDIVTNNPNLIEFSCSNNLLTSINVSSSPLLNSLILRNNQITNLNVENNTDLLYIDCGNNQIETLDVSQNPLLDNLDCFNNNLVTMNLQNGSIASNLSFASGNPDLEFICVDSDEADAIQATLDAYGYNNCEIVTDCTSLSVDDFSIDAQKSMYPNPVRNKLVIKYPFIMETISLYNSNGALIKKIYLSDNQTETQLDMHDLASGLYFVSVLSQKNVFTEKIVKK